VNDEHYPFSRGEDQPDAGRFRAFKNRSQWRWLQWLYRGINEDRWTRRERHLSEIERGNRSHLGGVFVAGHTRLEK